MILELDDGRELRLPDEMPDETARQLKALILALEGRARTAESDVRMLRDEMAALRRTAEGSAASNDRTANALAAVSRDIIAALRRVEAAALADREMVPNELGDMTRSRAVIRSGG